MEEEAFFEVLRKTWHLLEPDYIKKWFKTLKDLEKIDKLLDKPDDYDYGITTYGLSGGVSEEKYISKISRVIDDISGLSERMDDMEERMR